MEPRKHSPVFHAAGGDIEGFRIRRKGASMGICVSCKHKVYTARVAWFRATRPTCNRCGGLLEPSIPSQIKNEELSCVDKHKPKKKRTCCLCDTVLRSTNFEIYCSACTKNFKLLAIKFFPSEIVEMNGRVTQDKDGKRYFTGQLRIKHHSVKQIENLCFSDC